MPGLSFSSRAMPGWWQRMRGRCAPVAPPRKEPLLPQGAFAADVAKVAPAAPARADVFAPYRPPRGVRANGSTAPLAMDSAAAQGNHGFLHWLRNAVADGVVFPGYARLAEMAQRAEYRHMVDTIATEATRQWLVFTSRTGQEQSKAARISQLEAEFTRLNVRDVLRRMAEMDGHYGMGLLYVDTGLSPVAGGLASPLLLRPETFRKGSLRALVPVEPVWTTPAAYETTNPLHPAFYRPQSWWVQGTLLHASRLLRFCAREVPDILKPAYNFGGVSLTQMARPYVENW